MKLSHLFAIPVGLIAAALTFCVNACDRNNLANDNRVDVQKSSTDSGETTDVKDNQTDEAANDIVSIISNTVADEHAAADSFPIPNPDEEIMAWYGPGMNQGRTLDDYVPKDPSDSDDAAVAENAIPRVKMVAPPNVDGAYDRRIVQKVIRQHTSELRACYERETEKNKDLSGIITFVWLIDGKGSVSNILVKESTVKDKGLESCAIEAIKNWRFPSPKGDGLVKVELAFNFSIE